MSWQRWVDVQFSFRLLFEPCDLWIGAFWDRDKRRLYLLPIPCFGLIVQFPLKRRDLRESIEALREAGGNAWEGIDDPAEFLGRKGEAR